MPHDLRVALRTLTRSPGFTALVVLTLALGIGANAALFSVVHAVLLRPLPYRQPERLVQIWETFEHGRGTGTVSFPNFRDWQQGVHAFESLAAYGRGSVNLQGAGDPERLSAIDATAGLFPELGVQPLLGRTFQPDEDASQAARVAVISEGLWRRRFGADPAVIGRSLTLDGQPTTVIGVMPASFTFPPGSVSVELWRPYRPDSKMAGERGAHMLRVVGRLRPEITRERAEEELSAIAAHLAEQYPNEQAGRGVLLRPLHEAVVGTVRPALLLLLGAVGLVLLIACANVANLLLARAAGRRHDVAVRAALGASRWRLARHFLAESLVLAFGGAVLGSLVAYAGLRGFGVLAAGVLPNLGPIRLDGAVFAYLLGVALMTGLGFGLAPALRGSRPDLQRDLVEGGTKSTFGAGHRRLRGALVVAEIALSLVLLAGAGLLLRAFLLLRATPPGFDPQNVLTLHVAVAGHSSGGEAWTRLLVPALERLRAVPGVLAAGTISVLPIEGWGVNGNFTIEGRPAPPPGDGWRAELRAASPGFPEALGIPLREGRLFTEQDGTPGHKTVLINEALARRHFPGLDPLGQRLSLEEIGAYEIVGILGDVRQSGLDREPEPEIHFPYRDTGVMGWLPDMVLVLKTAVPPESVEAAARAAVAAVDPDQPLYSARTLKEIVADSLADRRLYLALLGTFAGLALVLAAAGIYGVLSHMVTLRTREFGIRMALGARRWDVLRLVLRQGLGLLGLGVGLGLGGALALTRLLQSLLYGVSATDPPTLVGVVAVLSAVALAACLMPARRATRVDPVVALHHE
jgi:putative ABC transport system permease protein